MRHLVTPQGKEIRPTLSTCMAWRCGMQIDGRPFCPAHWKNVPHHIRRAIIGEEQACVRGGGKRRTDWLLDLLQVANAMELESRMADDPEVKAMVDAEMKAEQAKKGAAQLGISGPDGKALA